MKIKELLARPEGKTLEFKQNLSGTKNILKTLTAFANTAGGVLLIGIEDESRAVLGVENPLDEEERLCNLISDSIEPRLVPNVEMLNWDGRTLLVVEVYPSPMRPHWLKSEGMENGVLVRVGSTNRQADGPLIAEMRRSALNLSYDEEPMPALNPEVLDFRVASGLFAGLREWNEHTPDTLRLITQYQGRLVPTIGGMLLFGSVRDRYFPDAWVQCGRFAGTDKARILDQQDIREHLPIALNEAFDFVRKHGVRSAEFEELRRRDVWNVPLDAIREALINAIVHADYAQTGAPIRVAIFDDRIEIENPGLLTGGLTIGDVRAGVSKLRNRVIGRVFKELNLIEQWGSGFQRMAASCLEMGLPEPVMEEITFRFRVTFSLNRVSDRPQSDDTERRILDLIRASVADGGASPRYLSQTVGISSRAMRRRLAGLVKAGQIFPVGKSAYDPDKRYLPVNK
ncbi:MAG: putative DNA binding domain-containing protein [Caldilineaceae bacterium]|nr:putative DNA binding domain-containing protein [Caldilineaceae bacterium]MBP8109836.1 putative DNA binding domain-containing protein [Caldilineaceae bacterium]MBP8125292.1 putative DNA binding domain-containing protein [Caldilineaceae bacterium]MBP9074890.1 putative DNA binding domain-containing protein [Caldilineaceae bacterium]